MLFVLLVLKSGFLAARLSKASLHTSLASTAGALDIIATCFALALTFSEDVRTIVPSTTLVLYFSALGMCSLPRLRTLWIIEDVIACSLAWTFMQLLIALALILESRSKSPWASHLEKGITREQLSSFWSRSLFVPVLPFLRSGSHKTIGVADIPEVDQPLRSRAAFEQLQPGFVAFKGRGRLARASLYTFKWRFLSGIPARLSLTAFTFCQAFLLSHTLELIDKRERGGLGQYEYGTIGAYVLVYLGLAVSRNFHLFASHSSSDIHRIGLQSNLS